MRTGISGVGVLKTKLARSLIGLPYIGQLGHGSLSSTSSSSILELGFGRELRHAF